MAFQFGKPRGRYRPLSEINVTPLVDVMLVLLIIFMVTAPLMTTSVNIDLPKVAATPINQDSEPLRVQVDSQGAVYLQDTQIGLPDLVAKLQAIAQNQNDRRIFVRGDKANSYGRMLEVMATIIQGGFTKVSLLTDPTAPIAVPQPGAAPGPAGGAPGATPAPPAGGTSGAATPTVITPSATTPAAPGPKPTGRG
jgi:biopolymer transport protein TolR